MLYAYLDETGQESKDWVFIAGFLGNEDQWRNFLPAWEKGLGPQRKSLHMSGLRFKKDRERRLLKRIAPIPVECKLEPVLGGVRVSDYEDLFEGDSFLEKLNAGYVVALMPLIIQVLRWMPPDERLEIMFEQQDRYIGLTDFTLKNILSAVMDDPSMITSDGKPKLAKWSFVPKNSTCLTEPSDYFAYAIAQYYKDSTSLKTQWCLPILRSVESVHPIGAIMERLVARHWAGALMQKLKEDNVVMPKTNEEFENFRKLANQVMQVSHDELKAKLDLERAEKEAKKRKNPRKSSASREADEQD